MPRVIIHLLNSTSSQYKQHRTHSSIGYDMIYSSLWHTISFSLDAVIRVLLIIMLLFFPA